MGIVISSRQSALAKIQAYQVGQALLAKNPKLDLEFVFKKSIGDNNQSAPLSTMADKGVFTQDFREDLIKGNIDLAVHSWKDLPTEASKDTLIAASLPRADLRDMLLVSKATFSKIKETKAITVLSSSPRREYNAIDFLKWGLPAEIKQVKFYPIRGNVPTRLRKLLESNNDGLVVAKAAIDRILSCTLPEFAAVQRQVKDYLAQCYWMILPLSVSPCAPAQGALAIEVLKTRQDLISLLKEINCPISYETAKRERDCLARYGGGCHQKIGVAALNRNFGEITYLKGLTDDGQVLNSIELSGENATPKTTPDKIWPLNIDKASLFRRKPIENIGDYPKNKDLWVARAEALPKEWSLMPEQTVWTAGLKSWKKLAKRGIWVNGCADALGEDENPNIDSLLGRKADWLKLSHTTAPTLNTEMSQIGTYELLPKDEEPNLAGKSHFYWMSGSSFLYAIELYPEILQAWHACGPGNTYKIISDKLETTSRLEIFLSYEDWKETVLE